MGQKNSKKTSIQKSVSSQTENQDSNYLYKWNGTAPLPDSSLANNSLEKDPHKLTDADYAYLAGQTGHSKEQIRQIFDQFSEKNPDGRLDRREFVELYKKLRPEDPDRLDDISQYVFQAFDHDQNGWIDFNEFMISYSLTSRGDLKQKLEYAFLLYDIDRNGYLDKYEMREVITGMLDLLGANQRTNNANQIAEECMRELDVSQNGQVSKSNSIF